MLDQKWTIIFSFIISLFFFCLKIDGFVQYRSERKRREFTEKRRYLPNLSHVKDWRVPFRIGLVTFWIEVHLKSTFPLLLLRELDELSRHYLSADAQRRSQILDLVQSIRDSQVFYTDREVLSSIFYLESVEQIPETWSSSIHPWISGILYRQESFI